jgi:hypothetical protein
VTRPLEIPLEIERVVAERGFGLRARGGKRCGKLLRSSHHLHAATAAASRGLEQNRKTERVRE